MKCQIITAIATLVTFVFTGIIAFWCIFRYKLFSVVPIARDKVMESIQEGIMIVDDLGRLIDKNAALDGFIVDIMGERRDILGKSVDSLLSDWPRWLTACKDMCADEFEIDSSVFGGERYYRLKVYPLNEKSSKIRGTVSILSDITESRLREDELISSSELTKEQLKDLAEELINQKKQLEAIFENMSDHCVVVDKAGKYIKVNKAAKEFIPSIKVSEVGDWLKCGRYYDILGNEIHSGTIPAVRLIHGETFSNYRLIVKNSDQEVHFDVNGTPVYDENGEFLFGVLCSHDVTALITHEKEIMVKNEQLETIVNTMSDMAILSISDREGNFLYYSNSANGYFEENTFNVKAGSTYRRGEYLYEDGSVIELTDMPVFRVLRGEKVINFHFVRKTTKGEIHFLLNGTPVYDMEGTLTHGVYFNMDITDQVQHKRIVSAMEQLATLNALKDKLFTVVTHDIRNPLATLVSMMELLEGEKEHCCEYKEIITSVGEQIKNTYFMVENLLDWFRSQKNNPVFSPRIWNLSKIACEAVNVYQNNAETKGIQISNNIDEDLTVFADKDMLEFVLRNLVNNAIKYTGNGGVITLQANKPGKKVIVSVSDNGVGIDTEKVKTLFNLADTSSTIGTAGEKGTGLGLLICKEFAEHNDGELWLESIHGEGSTFYFSIPSDGGSKDGQPD